MSRTITLALLSTISAILYVTVRQPAPDADSEPDRKSPTLADNTSGEPTSAETTPVIEAEILQPATGPNSRDAEKNQPEQPGKPKTDPHIDRLLKNEALRELDPGIKTKDDLKSAVMNTTRQLSRLTMHLEIWMLTNRQTTPPESFLTVIDASTEPDLIRDICRLPLIAADWKSLSAVQTFEHSVIYLPECPISLPVAGDGRTARPLFLSQLTPAGGAVTFDDKSTRFYDYDEYPDELVKYHR